MSILVVALDEPLAIAVIRRLAEQGDEPRALTSSEGVAASLRRLGTKVAVGDTGSGDLVARAAYGCRTIVIAGAPGEDEVEAAKEAYTAYGVDRLVVAGPAPSDGLRDAIARAFPTYAILIAERRGFLRSTRADPEDVAAAVDAADDLAGEPRLVIDLSDPRDRAVLGL